jgi:hypothetical protein
MAQKHLSVIIGRISFVFEKQACHLAVVNMADMHSDKDSVYSDSVIMVVKKMSTSLLNQIYNHKVTQT